MTYGAMVPFLDLSSSWESRRPFDFGEPPEWASAATASQIQLPASQLRNATRSLTQRERRNDPIETAEQADLPSRKRISL